MIPPTADRTKTYSTLAISYGPCRVVRQQADLSAMSGLSEVKMLAIISLLFLYSFIFMLAYKDLQHCQEYGIQIILSH